MNPQEAISRRQLFRKILERVGQTAVVAPLVAAACGASSAEQIPSAPPALSNPNVLRTPLDQSIFAAWKTLVKTEQFSSAGVIAKLLDYQEATDGSLIAVWTVPSWGYTKKVQFNGFHTELSTYQIGGQTTLYLLEYNWRQAGLLKDGTYTPFTTKWENGLDGVGCQRAQGANTTPQCTASRSSEGLHPIIYTWPPGY